MKLLLSVGDPVRVRISSQGEWFPARIISISVYADTGEICWDVMGDNRIRGGGPLRWGENIEPIWERTDNV